MDWSLIYQYIRGTFELLQFVSTVVVAGLGLFIFRQLRLAQESLDASKESIKVASETLIQAKNDNLTRIEREAVILAAQLTEQFGNEIIPKGSELIDGCVAGNIGITEWNIKDNNFDLTSLESITEANSWLRELKNAGKHVDVTKLLNQLEAYAIYFVEGAADEKIAFPTTASVFCSYVKRIVPMLIALRRQEPGTNIVSGPYQNTIKLYIEWSARIKKQKLEAEAAKLLEESSGIHLTKIPVLGTSAKAK